MQKIPIKQTRTLNGRTLGLVIEDMNFDSYQDIRIQSGTPSGPNTPYFYWIWDPKAGAFMSNPDLEHITAPVFDYDNQTIQSFVREGAELYSDNTYRYINNIPTLIKRIEKVADAQKKMWHVTVRELVNKQLSVIRQYEEPLRN
jgi:hypothetical protein